MCITKKKNSIISPQIFPGGGGELVHPAYTKAYTLLPASNLYFSSIDLSDVLINAQQITKSFALCNSRKVYCISNMNMYTHIHINMHMIMHMQGWN